MKHLAMVVGLSLALAACGQPGQGGGAGAGSGGGSVGQQAPPSPSSRTVTLDLRDNGRTVTLHPGDRLVLALRSGPSTGSRWRLALYPKDVLSLEAGGGRNGLVMDARRAGQGRVAALDLARAGPSCGVGGPRMGAKASIQCPMIAQSERGAPPRPGVFLVTVVVR